MMEGAIMEYVKWFIGIMSLVFVTMLTVLLFRLNEINTFQQEVNYQIERNGGITAAVKEELNAYAENEFEGYISFNLHEVKPLDDVYDIRDNGEVVHKGRVNDKEAEVFGFSGFTLVEVAENEELNDGTLYIVDRKDEKAHYGTPVKYVLKRHVGRIIEFSLDPVVIGESASRVRGSGNDGRQ